jgi:hypothetical protein
MAGKGARAKRRAKRALTHLYIHSNLGGIWRQLHNDELMKNKYIDEDGRKNNADCCWIGDEYMWTYVSRRDLTLVGEKDGRQTD